MVVLPWLIPVNRWDSTIRSNAFEGGRRVAHFKAIESEKSCWKPRRSHVLPSRSSLFYWHCRQVYQCTKIGIRLARVFRSSKNRTERKFSPIPTYSSVPALLHFCKSPPFPHPKSKTFTLGTWSTATPSLLANLAIKTDLIQLLKFFNPIIGDSNRVSLEMFGLALSVWVMSLLISSEWRERGKEGELTMISYDWSILIWSRSFVCRRSSIALTVLWRSLQWCSAVARRLWRSRRQWSRFRR